MECANSTLNIHVPDESVARHCGSYVSLASIRAEDARLLGISESTKVRDGDRRSAIEM